MGVWGIVLLSLGALFSLGARAQSTAGLSARERARLGRGELVTREVSMPQGRLRLIGGTSYQVIDAPVSAVWSAVRDVGHYRRFIPQATESRLVSSEDERRLVRIRHKQGPVEASYYMRVQFSSGQRMARFWVDRSLPHSIRDGWGFFNVRSHRNGKSLLTFGVLADVGSGFLSGLVRPRIHEWMLRVPDEFRKWVEGPGRRRYAP